MRGTEMVEVNFEKLKEQFKKRGLTSAKAGRELGFSDNYFANVKARGRMSKSGALLLDRVYGIKESDYAVHEEQEVKVETIAQPIDYDKLYEVIYTAVYQAVKMAWKEC